MSVRQQLLATMILCLAITLGMIFALHVQQRHETKTLTESFTRERTEQLADAMNEQSEALGIFVQDYSGWDDMVSFVSSLNPEWARLNIEEVMERYRLSAVWLVSSEGKVLYSHFQGVARPEPPDSLSAVVTARNWADEIGGFYRSGDAVVELRARPVQPTADTRRESRPVAWLLAARVLDGQFIERMERKLQARVVLHPPFDQKEEPQVAHAIVVHHALDGLFGARPVAEVDAVFPKEMLELGEYYNSREMLVWGVATALLLGVVGWSISRNVLRPLGCIASSLEDASAGPLAGVSRGLPEFARISDLIRESFQQREALRREIEERARLGRDLHDGVIQNLYATGMGIAHGMRMMESEPEKARARLEETLRSLNETMEALRGFIARAEPESAAEVDFADGCVTLFQTLRVHRECQLDLDVEPDAERAIPAAQKANLLFIVREAISNALRHGEARNIAVSLRRSTGRWELRVRDDGRGSDFAASKRGGRGLENIRARAESLGGAPRFAAAPGGGVEVLVEWPAARARA